MIMIASTITLACKIHLPSRVTDSHLAQNVVGELDSVFIVFLLLLANQELRHTASGM